MWTITYQLDGQSVCSLSVQGEEGGMEALRLQLQLLQLQAVPLLWIKLERAVG